MTHGGCIFCESTAAPILDFDASDLSVRRCPACNHRQAVHGERPPTSDYYDHTPQDTPFLRSLETTRRRQARRIVRRAAELFGKPANWLDFGCGRGWLLDELRSTGSSQTIAGFDSSPISRQWLEQNGIESLPSSGTDPHWPDFASLSFSPRVVSLLDVAEHFPGDRVSTLFRDLSAALPTLEWLVVKVPVSSGVLYRGAHALRFKFPGPYRQLYQVGTFPPHYHYFTTRSLRYLIEKAGYDVACVVEDADVDNLFHRMGRLSVLPGGGLAARALRLFPADSAILFARRRSSNPPGVP
jgi:hypothetical protein